jgi:hypothetical protein
MTREGSSNEPANEPGQVNRGQVNRGQVRLVPAGSGSVNKGQVRSPEFLPIWRQVSCQQQ